MHTDLILQPRNRCCDWLRQMAAICALLTIATNSAAAQIEGFTEPYRSIDVAATEPGIIKTLEVREGEDVEKDQILAGLNDAMLKVSLQIAEKNKEAEGELDAAIAEQALKSDRFTKLETLKQSDHASQEEVDRAATELAIAEARVRAVQEAMQIRKLEYERIKVQLVRRSIRSPIDGVVTRIYRDVGEYLSPSEPVILTVVQLDRLFATFSIPSLRARQLSSGQQVRLKLSDAKTSIQGVIEFVSPVTDAESGTVRIKVRFPNPDGQHRSGERATLLLGGQKTPRLSGKLRQ